ncbi:hypothetical protein OHT57_01440 [Streptomyces sp. NBC_00285]|uniref:hypothetical protein n=1 Tax=Streptomyces sp. NBC_00285 TaxID=2975700 RepID=UPI002E2A5387|nr:hypothetical protein [Streptomyces sp. NBC_00285]
MGLTGLGISNLASAERAQLLSTAGIYNDTGTRESVTDSVAGTFTARYDADGGLATQTLPGGYTQSDEQDTTGSATARTDTRIMDGTVLAADSVSENPGRVGDRHCQGPVRRAPPRRRR